MIRFQSDDLRSGASTGTELGRWQKHRGIFACAAVLLTCSSGCVVEAHKGHYYGNGGYTSGGYAPAACPTPQPLAQTEIQTGVALNASAGTAAVTSMEYLGNGNWHVFSTCDTLLSGLSCTFDITARTVDGAPIQGITSDGDDQAQAGGPDTAILRTYTTSEIDGMRFTTTPGSSVNVTALLDGCADYTAMILVGRPVTGDPAPVYSAPSDPVELIPTSP